jgi:hypothetical protein
MKNLSIVYNPTPTGLMWMVLWTFIRLWKKMGEQIETDETRN